MNLKEIFSKKKENDLTDAVASEIKNVESEVSNSDSQIGKTVSANSNVAITKIQTEIEKIKASVEAFGEVRKSITERIAGLSEQIGELRAMIMDRDRTIQKIELKAVKAADLVETVQPEKLMIEIQKEDAKFEALKANIEGNEAIMTRVMDELKELRKKMEFFRGVEEIIKLSEEVKRELVDIKKTEASIHIDSDKVETIYAELRKKYKDVDLFNDDLQEFKLNLSEHGKDLEGLKMKLTGVADKQEVEKLTSRVEAYINSFKELNRSTALSKDIVQLKKLLDGLK